MAKVQFDKKFWQKNRDSVCKGSGVGNALDVWQNRCPRDTASINTGKDYDAAYTAIENLTKKLGVAKKKASAGKKSKSKTDTLGVITEFEKKIKSYKATLDKAHNKWLQSRHLADSDPTAYKRVVKAFAERKQKLVAYVKKSFEYTDWRHAHLKQVNDELDDRMTKLENAIEGLDAITANEQMTAMRKYLAHGQKTMREIDAKYQKDAPYIKKERGSEASAKSMGVLPKDAAPYEKLFIEATRITNDISRLHKSSTERLKTAEKLVARAEKLNSAGKKTVQQMIDTAADVRGRVSEIAKTLDYAERNTIANVDRIAKVHKEAPKQGAAELRASQKAVDSYSTNVRKFSKQFSSNLKQVNRSLQLLDKRIPKAMRKDKKVSGHLKTVVTVAKNYKKKETNLNKKVASAEKQYQTIKKLDPKKVAIKNK